MSGLVPLSNIILDFRQATGEVNAGGTLEFFDNLTTTDKDVYNGYGSATPLANPLQLDAGGFEPGVWLGAGSYSIRLRGPAPTFPTVLGPIIWTKDNVNVTSAVTAQPGNLIANGSFEGGDDGTGTGAPNNWALTTYTGSTFLIDGTDSRHGAYSAKCTSAGNGGATLVTTEFTVCSVSDAVVWKLLMKSSVADVRNIVSIAWYDSDQALLSTTSVYDDSATNPTSWTVKSGVATPPANSKFYKVTLVGCDPSDATAGSTWFDGVEFGTLPRQETANTWTGVQAYTAANTHSGAETHSGIEIFSTRIDLTGGQLKFPATAVPSADANTLDDYEEGTWTPSIGGTATYLAANVGYYTKIGRMVVIVGVLSVNVRGTGSTNTVSGLPFPIDASPLHGCVSSWTVLAIAVGNLAIITSGLGGGTSFGFEGTNAGTTATSTDTVTPLAVIGNGTNIAFQATYFTNS
jgi:hypothetical protein